MIKLQKLNVVKYVLTEQQAVQLEADGFHRCSGNPKPRKPRPGKNGTAVGKDEADENG